MLRLWQPEPSVRSRLETSRPDDKPSGARSSFPSDAGYRHARIPSVPISLLGIPDPVKSSFGGPFTTIFHGFHVSIKRPGLPNRHGPEGVFEKVALSNR